MQNIHTNKETEKPRLHKKSNMHNKIKIPTLQFPQATKMGFLGVPFWKTEKEGLHGLRWRCIHCMRKDRGRNSHPSRLHIRLLRFSFKHARMVTPMTPPPKKARAMRLLCVHTRIWSMLKRCQLEIISLLGTRDISLGTRVGHG
jgi:hypothetical protein